MAGPSKSFAWVLKGLKIVVNGRSIDGRNFTLEKMARSLFGEDICWAFHSSSLLSDISKTFLLLCITCCTNINQRAFLRFFSSDSKIFESPCCTLKTSTLSATSHWRRATKPSGLDGGQNRKVGRHRAHICHEYHELYSWRKNCHVEKFQLSMYDNCGEIENFSTCGEISVQLMGFYSNLCHC